MQTIYAIGARFAGGGIGNTAYHAARGIWEAGVLNRLLVSSYRQTDIPTSVIHSMGLFGRGLKRAAVMESGGTVNAWADILFDHWASRQLIPCDLFHGWGNMCLHSLRRAKSLGAITIVERASTHPREQMRLLEETYTRLGLSWRHNRRHSYRAEMEFAEADYVTIPSDFVRHSFLTHGFDPQRLIQFPFGVDAARFKPRRRTTGVSTRPFCALFVGQISPRKGALDLLEAWRQLAWPAAELWLVGRVDPAIKTLLAPYEGSDSVRFAGHLPDPVKVYQSADVFIFPSIEEGSALVTYEAMACGLPMITTPNAGSVARHEGEALIVPPANVPALIDALTRLRDDEKLRGQLGAAARRRAEQYTWEAYGRRLVAAYRRVVENRGGKRSM